MVDELQRLLPLSGGEARVRYTLCIIGDGRHCHIHQETDIRRSQEDRHAHMQPALPQSRLSTTEQEPPFGSSNRHR